MHMHIVRRAAALTAVLVLLFGLSVSATTSAQTTTADTTGATDTTVSATTTTTATPTEARVNSMTYTVENLPRGAAILGNDPQWEQGRNSGKALRLDGNTNYIQIDISKQSDPFTLSMWVNWQATVPSSNAMGQRLFTFFKKNTENNLSMTPWLQKQTESGDTVNGIALLGACYKENWLRQEIYYPATDNVFNLLPPQVWHHIALTVSGNTVTVYIDGMEWIQETLSFAYTDLKADTLLIGGGGGGSYLFEGLLQDVQLYENALTPTQIGRIAKDADPFDATVEATPHAYSPAPLSDDMPTALTVYAETQVTGGAFSTVIPKTDTANFLENPTLSGGQSVSGTLTVENKSKHSVDMALQSITLPAKGTPAWEYLSEITVTVSSEGKVLYTGAYTDITAETLGMQFEQMAYGRSHVYTVTLSRPLTAKATYADVSVPWEFSVNALAAANSPLRDTQSLDWLLILLPLSAIAVGFSLYWAVSRRNPRIFSVWNDLTARLRKGKQQDAEQEGEEIQPTETEQNTEDVE